MFAEQGQFTEAQSFQQQSVELFKARGQPGTAAAAALLNLGYTLRHLGQYETARSHCQMALTFYREMGVRSHLRVNAQVDLGAIWLAQAAYSEARQILQESVATARDIGEHWVLGESLALLGHVARALGDNDQAR
jgi:tetratricopeptide (TPR) repeat protein